MGFFGKVKTWNEYLPLQLVLYNNNITEKQKHFNWCWVSDIKNPDSILQLSYFIFMHNVTNIAD